MEQENPRAGGEKCYLPANKIILDNIDHFRKERRKFKVAYSVSGVLIEQCERWGPDLLDSFKQLAESGCVEFLCQTYFHSLSSPFSIQRKEFIEQVSMHRRLMRDLFKQEPIVFENTEAIFNNSIAKTMVGLGFKGIFTEGAERLTGPVGTSAHLLRVVPPERAFHLHEDGDYINLSAHSLDELKDVLMLASDRSVLFHAACKHFERWVRFTMGDGELADEIAKVEGVSAADLKQKIYNCINTRLLKLKSVGAET